MGRRMSGYEKLKAYDSGMSVDDIESFDRRMRKRNQRDPGDLDSMV